MGSRQGRARQRLGDLVRVDHTAQAKAEAVEVAADPDARRSDRVPVVDLRRAPLLIALESEEGPPSAERHEGVVAPTRGRVVEAVEVAAVVRPGPGGMRRGPVTDVWDRPGPARAGPPEVDRPRKSLRAGELLDEALANDDPSLVKHG